MWFIPVLDALGDMALGALALLVGLVFFGPEMPEMPPGQHPTKTKTIEKFDTFADNGGAEYRVSAKITDNNRCLVQVYVNGHGPFTEIADSGAPDLWFNVKDLPQLGIDRSTLHFSYFSDREGNVAWVTLQDVRIGQFIPHNITAAISDKANYRLLGMSGPEAGAYGSRGRHLLADLPAQCTASRSH